MFNTNVYSGTDGTLTLSTPIGIDEQTWGRYFGEVAEVGRVTNIAISVNTAIRAFHELGSHLPRELRAGSVSIDGTIERAYINGAMLTLMLGKASSEEEKVALKIPSFDMKIASSGHASSQRPHGASRSSTSTPNEPAPCPRRRGARSRRRPRDP